jgi:hypothetical protein
MKSQLARVGIVGIAETAAGGPVADEALRARRETLAAFGVAGHPCMPWELEAKSAQALSPLWTGGALAVRAVHHGTCRGSLLIENTALAFWACAAFARRPTGRTREGVRAEETLRATLRITFPTWTPTPACTAKKPRCTRRVLVRGDTHTVLPFLADPWRDAVADQGASSESRKWRAGEALWALRIRDALAISAVPLPHARIGEASQGFLAVCALRAISVVGLKGQALLERKHRADWRALLRTRLWTLKSHARDHQDKGRWNQKRAQERQERAPVHPHS